MTSGPTDSLEVADCEVPATRTELKSRPWFCRTMQTVSDDLPKCLGPGHMINNTKVGLCRGRWQWYQLSTVHEHLVPYYVIEQPAGGGPAQHVRKTRVEMQRHAVALELQTSHCPHSYDPTCEALGGTVRDYYTTVDVLVIDGDPSHAWDTTDPWSERKLVDHYRGDYVGEQYRYYKGRRRLVMGLGYKVNRSRAGPSGCSKPGCADLPANRELEESYKTSHCLPRLKDKVNIGIYCSWNPSDKLLKIKPCMYSLKAHLIPERVYDGYEATLPLAPVGEQGYDDSAPSKDVEDDLIGSQDYQQDVGSVHFRADVSDFDVLSVEVTRSGNNLTSTDAAGRVVSNGHGMLGYLVRAHGGQCPTYGDNFFQSVAGGNDGGDEHMSIHETSTTVTSGAFCTTTASEGTHRFAVQARDQFGPFPVPPKDTFEQGMVGIDLFPLAMPDKRVRFKQQPGYGAFHVKVRHVAYFAGALTSGERRPSCLSYGQWRYFTITTSGTTDAAVLTQLSAPVSAVMLRADRRPSADEVMGGSVSADVVAPAGLLRVSATPCDVVRPTTWHLALRMLPEPEAALQGIEPLEFHFDTFLESAAAQLDTPITPPTHNTSGRGYVCCGATRNFRIPDIPPASALNLKVRLTAGTARAALVKWNVCPQPAKDIDSTTGLCRGFCELGWLATRGGFSGVLYNKNTTEVQIPVGAGNALDKRRAGAWYLAVQALPGVAAHFELAATLFKPENLALDKCSRYTKVCSTDSARLAWTTGPPGAPAPPPELEGEPWIMEQVTYRRGVPTIGAAILVMLGMIYYQHLKRRRLHQRISQRV